jgi:hypothetical protein
MHRTVISLVSRLGAPALVAAAAALAACGSPPPPPVFHVTFTALSDTMPLAGVQITREGRPLGTTDAAGRLEVRLTGQEGMAVGYRAECPAGYRTPPTPPPLVLRQFRSVAVPGQPAAPPRGIEVTLQCPPTQRYAAVIVRAGGFAGIPVVMSGREVTRTDASGAAHFTLPLAPNTSFAVGLDTSANPNLKPASPTASFTIGDADDILVFDPPLHEELPPATPHVHHGGGHHVIRPTGPVRIR